MNVENKGTYGTFAGYGAVSWVPMAVLLPAALALGPWLPAWLWMWAIAVAIYAGFKWSTLTRALSAGVHPVPVMRCLIYLLLWPGMDARSFLFSTPPPVPSTRAWMLAGLKTAFGAVLLWGAARWMGGGLLAGWTGMVGIIFLLHFGSFELMALLWQGQGINAQPLMHAPILSASLGEFWSRRWNSGFRDLVFGLWFARIKRRLGARTATLLIFVVSGLIHDLVISLPAGGGYGLPTTYFTLQGAGLLAEHARGSALSRWRGRWPGRAWTWLVVAGPAFWLFHPLFVRRVILPFMRAVYAL